MPLTKKFLRRYSNLPSLIYLLSKKALTFLDPESWDDRNDSLFMRLYKEKKQLATLLAVCFSQETETYHHWSVFASGSSGVCISFYKEELLAELNQYDGIRGRRVSYISLNELAQTSKRITNLPFMKRAPFKPESEYRVIFEDQGKPRSYIDIDIPLSCIDRVYLSPWMPRSVAESVKSVLKGVGGAEDIEVVRSTLIENDRWAKFGKSVVGEFEDESHSHHLAKN
ncbi:hypothetical protein [Occallatibacter riparius]|uniref:DUF2971 domain-containing protein n=1 Tax=Occallatibacter riparius TaxID=1002689 RepID=A0A9J7BJ37_9BACT|nr:hypothetical protein [Occallatibacter riparius]UWZ81810.1 hypothetical protein MOP44_14580 [Occallatibacter riparius]